MSAKETLEDGGDGEMSFVTERSISISVFSLQQHRDVPSSPRETRKMLETALPLRSVIKIIDETSECANLKKRVSTKSYRFNDQTMTSSKSKRN